MMAVFSFFLSPIGRWVGALLLVGALIGGYTLKVRHDAWVSFQAKAQREHDNEVQKGSTARDGAIKRFDNGRVRDDGYARD